MLAESRRARVAADALSANCDCLEIEMHGKHVVVTGAGTGIGRAIARRLAREGASLTLLARDRDRLEQTAAALEVATHVVSSDIRERGRVDRAFEVAAAALGPVHALVAVSGLGGPNADGPDDRFDELVRVNVNGTYYCCRAAVRHLAPGPDARHLVVLSSILARIPVPGYTGYSASKAALLGLVRSLAAELARENVQVNAICPGWVDTDMAWAGLDGIAEATGGTREDAYREAMRDVPMGRMSQPDDIAGTVAWLLSPDARGVTGQAIDQNGGAWMG
jgi:NAD(P)-dependent dehydrogenase (short-subunit alcohol dehydrogenase family)